jgi:glycine/D-amino acid oxidase-like deaminating enzyme
MATGDDTSAFQEDALLAADLGFDASFVNEVPSMGGPGIVFADQARVHPRRYLAGMARAIVDRGGLIFEHSAADEFSNSPRSVSQRHTVTCEHVVLATHTPLMTPRLVRDAVSNEARAVHQLRRRRTRAEGQVPDALFWDNADPYHYLRLEPRRDHDVIIFGGEDHKTGQVDTEARFSRLERTLTSMIRGVDITHRWSGQVIETPDGLPYIGETADRQFAGTGYSGNGMTFGTLAGMMACDRIGRRNSWDELFDPGRTKILAGVWDYIVRTGLSLHWRATASPASTAARDSIRHGSEPSPMW